MDGKNAFSGLIGRSEEMQNVYEQIKKVSETDVPVLILGESGTGKDLVAQSIHRNSPRNGGPFVPVNMGALSYDLIESELFGYERGAFTGADKRKIGKFELAHSGTLFLDEIATMEKKVQISLLRVLETSRFQRVGGVRFVAVDARIIAATNNDMAQAVEDDSFREDLFYRLSVFPISLPPLRTRGDDVLLIARELLKRYSGEFGKDVEGFTPKAEDCLSEYSWPGNVRELENVIMKALIMSKGRRITDKYLPKKDGETESFPRFALEVGTSIEDAERLLLEKTLEYTGGNKTHAADLLNISRKSLYNKIHYYNLFRKN